jgi:hypothetical protein
LIYFDLPVELAATATFDTNADLKIGAQLDMDFGDAYVYWTPATHWQHTKPEPKLTFTPTVSTAAALTATAYASVTPTLTARSSVFGRISAAPPAIESHVSWLETSIRAISYHAARVFHPLTGVIMNHVKTLKAHFDKILSYQIVAKPEFNFQLDGSEASKQVCAKSTAQVAISSSTNLDINIPWANIHQDKTWNDDIYDSGVLTLENKCVPL